MIIAGGFLRQRGRGYDSTVPHVLGRVWYFIVCYDGQSGLRSGSRWHQYQSTW